MQGLFWKRHQPVFVPFGITNVNPHSFGINISHSEVDSFAKAQPHAVDSVEKDFVAHLFGGGKIKGVKNKRGQSKIKIALKGYKTVFFSSLKLRLSQNERTYMPRLSRISPSGIAVHVMQRGNNRQVCFVADEDHWAYAGWLKDYSSRYKVDIHAWVMMTNHVHLLCTPHVDNGVSRMMQALGRRYVQYFNREYQRSGTLWEGRFKSCLVQTGSYLLDLYRYIECNPVRAKMVNDPGKYHWSSYQVNGLGKESELCTPHQDYMALGRNPVERQRNYREFISTEVEGELLKEIRENTNKGMAVGNERFKKEIEVLTGRRLHSKKRGRPVGWRKDKV